MGLYGVTCQQHGTDDRLTLQKHCLGDGHGGAQRLRKRLTQRPCHPTGYYHRMRLLVQPQLVRNCDGIRREQLGCGLENHLRSGITPLGSLGDLWGKGRWVTLNRASR
jgi:hypothetical protein